MTFSDATLVQVSNVTILQDSVPILNNVNFKIEKGEFVYLIGRTGSGKSSLLKLLYADLTLSDNASALVAGFNLKNIKTSQVSKLRRKIGIVFQDFQLFEDRSVSENLFFVMEATGWSNKSKIKNRLAEVLMQVGMASSGEKMPYQLSGGEKQRIAIARALLNDPLILIADEPTGNLDPFFSEEIQNLFLEINKQGTAVLMATHDYSMLKRHDARVLKCEKGIVRDSLIEKFDLESRF